MSNAVNTPDADRNSSVDDRPDTRTDHTVVNDTTAAPDRTDVVGRQRELFGGMKFGSCFFGWLTASGTAVLLAAVATGIGAALGLSRNVGAVGDIPRPNSVGRVLRRNRPAGDHLCFLPRRWVRGWAHGPIQRSQAGPRCVAVGRDHRDSGCRCRPAGRCALRPTRPGKQPAAPANGREHADDRWHHPRCRRRRREPHRRAARWTCRYALPPPGRSGRRRSLISPSFGRMGSGSPSEATIRSRRGERVGRYPLAPRDGEPR